MSRKIIRLSITAGLFGVAIGVIAVLPSGCTSVVNRFAFYPDRGYRVAEEELPAGMKFLTFPTEDGETIEAYFIAGTTRPDRLVLSFHGNAGNLAHRIPELQKIAALTGAAVLGSGYRGYGTSTGHASEAGIYRDGEAALSYAAGTLGFTPGQIVVIGRSLGSTVATHIAAHQPGLAGILLVTPLSTGRDFAAAHLKPIMFMAGGSFDNVGRARSLRMPALVIHGTADEVIPFTNGQRLFDTLPGPKRLVTIAGGDHNALEYVDPTAFWRAVAEFVASPGSATAPAE